MADSSVDFEDADQIRALFGIQDNFLKRIRKTLSIEVAVKDTSVHVLGAPEQVQRGVEVLRELRTRLGQRGGLSELDIQQALGEKPHEGGGRERNDEGPRERPDRSGKPGERVGENGGGRPAKANEDAINLLEKTKTVAPRTQGQREYVQSMTENDLVFCVGPAGSGKTYLAVAMAVNALRRESVKKIVLVRPAVEAGEKLGFLPGDMLAKVNPFLRPLLDALNEMIDFEQVKRYMERDIIEIVPLAFMRGRTLNNTFIILDEGQNTTVTQMKMFLTRLGIGSRIVVTGDTTQTDLPTHVPSGLLDAMNRLSSIEGVASVRLTGRDIVRHRLVREIVRAYDEETGPARPRRRN